MSLVKDDAEHIFREISGLYKNNVKPSVDIFRNDIFNEVVQLIALQEKYPAMLIWVFMQMRSYWLGIDSGGEIDKTLYPPLILQQIIARRIIDMMIEVEKGQLTIVPLEDPSASQPLVTYNVSNGWSLVIYTRMYAWYHVDTFKTPDLIEFDPFFLPDNELQGLLLDYEPPDEVQLKVYCFKNLP